MTAMEPHPFPFAPWIWRDAVAILDTRNEAVGDRDRPDVGLLGYEVEAVDGRIGKVDEANARVPADCLLVDTGTWLTSHQVVLPVGAVARIDHDGRVIHVDRTKEQVTSGPEYDPDTFDADAFRARLGDYYTESYRTAP
ncbi:PRC-barrel domain containing protein [Saccharothrix lopnurensis]|uniref:PRC-barrel domain containing protein n=1 Tax=Saccharothrix lopnurensis TaxID=1670621 RepID=A0ABW1PBA5_9PSEU